MSSISLSKIELRGYKFLSNKEFSDLETYLPGITYFVYDPDKDFTDPEEGRPELEMYFMRADRCVKVDMNGALTEIYSITNDSGTVIANYGTDVRFVFGTSYSDRITIKLPVGDTYAGKLPTRPSTSNLLFIGWSRNGELVTDTTVVKYGDELRAEFEIAGPNTHPFGPLFAETGRWVVNSSTFTARYTSEYRHAPSKLHVSVSAEYEFSSNTLTRNSPRVTLDIDEVFYTSDSSWYVPDVNYGTHHKWCSPYGASILQNVSTGEISLEYGHTESTIFAFDENVQEQTYWDEDLEEWITEEAVDYTGVTNTIYLGTGTGSIYAVQTDGSLRTVRSSVGNSSSSSSTTVTWEANDTGVLELRGTWSYISVGTSESTATSNYDKRPLISVANYAQSGLVANGFANHVLECFFVSGNLKLVNGGLKSMIDSMVVAGTLTTVASGLNGFQCTDLSVERFASSIVANWAAGATNGSTISGLSNLIIQTVPAGSNTVNLATGNSKFDKVVILDCHVISGTNTTATTTTFAAANIVGGIYIRYASDISIGAYGFNGLTNEIRLYSMEDTGIESLATAELRSILPATVYKAASGAVFYGSDLLGITFNGTSIATSPIDKTDRTMYAARRSALHQDGGYEEEL